MRDPNVLVRFFPVHPGYYYFDPEPLICVARITGGDREAFCLAVVTRRSRRSNGEAELPSGVQCALATVHPQARSIIAPP